MHTVPWLGGDRYEMMESPFAFGEKQWGFLWGLTEGVEEITEKGLNNCWRSPSPGGNGY